MPARELTAGRGRHCGISDESNGSALLWPLEREGPYPQGTALRPHQQRGNHGEDVKEYYFYLDSTPTHSYMKYLYKYPKPPFL